MNDNCTILHGNALTVLRGMESESVRCCVTSPPYWALRNYGVDGQIGLEETPEVYVSKLIEVFSEVRRILRSDGVLWLNLGDTYAGSWGAMSYPKDSIAARRFGGNNTDNIERPVNSRISGSLKPKDLVGIPWMVAFALRADGWYLRQDIIWHKPNPMPESVTDRCTKAHEYIFLLTKSARYYFNQEAIKEPLKDTSIARLIQDVDNQNGSDRVPGKTNGNMKAVRFGGNKYGDDDSELSRTKSGNEWKPKGRDRSNGNRNGLGASTLDKPHMTAITPGQTPHTKALNRMNGIPDPEYLSANKKSVWTVTTQPFKEAHFATFPEKLIEPCVLAGSKEGDLILDPFSGAGTTGVVALKHHRRYLGIELNEEYIEIAKKRLREVQVNLF